jgi:hypothetical protein
MQPIATHPELPKFSFKRGILEPNALRLKERLEDLSVLNASSTP